MQFHRVVDRTKQAILATLVLGAAFFAWATRSPPSYAQEGRGEDKPRVVELTIDYGDGVEKRFKALRWKEKMTVLDALRQAQEHPRGVKFKFRGSGAAAFLTQIDDLTNEGNGKNWMYRVNETEGDRSFGIYELEPEDSVLWKFAKPK